MGDLEQPVHRPVLLAEVLHYLAPRAGGLYVDVTLGRGGHSAAILEASKPDGRLVALDRDPDAVLEAAASLAGEISRVTVVQARFSRLPQVLQALGVGLVDGILADLGVSSPQLDRAERGFSFRLDGPLDMRMDPGEGESAADLVNTLSEAALTRIFRDYGEERFAGRVARAIISRRAQAPFTRTVELAGVVERAIPRKFWPERIHPATRVFQALRLAVNRELEELEAFLEGACGCLRPGGRLAVISFHSLEDRLVKHYLREQARACICPKELPMCRCGSLAAMRLLSGRSVEAGPEEREENPRARSARLRVAERLEGVLRPWPGGLKGREG